MMTSSASAIASASLPSAYASTSNSPCAACKFLRRKCQPDCVFAPYFPPDQPQKFAHVHKVFGASNVTKLLNDLNPYQREDAVNSLAYEAEMRLRDPVYGCVGVISILQHQLRQLQMDLTCAKSELSKYQTTNGLFNVSPSIGLGHANGGFGRDPLFAHSRENGHNHVMMRSYDGEMATRIGIDAGLMVAMNTSVANGGPFGFPFAKPSTAGGDERQTIGPS